MFTPSDVSFTEAICSHICHDSDQSKENEIPEDNIHTNSLPTIISKRFVSFAENTSDISEIFERGDAVNHYLESIMIQNSGFSLDKNHNILIRQDHKSLTDTVKILSGGPADLEPLFSGFIGPGMLTAAVFGQLRSSPPYLSILAALRVLAKDHDKGVLVIVMNSLSNRLNFGLACQQAAHEGIKTVSLTVGEDCSGVSIKKAVGRRGSSGIIFLYKIAGAMSHDKRSMYEMFCVLQALKGGSLGSVNAEVQPEAMTVGSGLCNEEGKKLLPINSISQVVKEVLHYIFNHASYFSLHFDKGDKIAVIVNNLGRLSDFHLTLTVREVFTQINSMGINILRLYSGRFLTSGRTGFSVSVLKVKGNTLKWLDSPVNVIGWPRRICESTNESSLVKEHSYLYIDKKILDSDFEGNTKLKNLGPEFTDKEASQAVSVLRAITKNIIDMEDHLNKLDNDHDFGSTIRMYMQSVKREMDSKTLIIVSPYGLFNHLAELAATTMGGVLGAVFSLLFCSAAQSFLTASSKSPVRWDMWIRAAKMARDAICSYTRVELGDRTILDALHPFVETFNTTTVLCLNQAVEAAKKGAEDTAARHPLGYPDPGAFTLALALDELFTELQMDLMIIERGPVKSTSECYT